MCYNCEGKREVDCERCNGTGFYQSFIGYTTKFIPVSIEGFYPVDEYYRGHVTKRIIKYVSVNLPNFIVQENDKLLPDELYTYLRPS